MKHLFFAFLLSLSAAMATPFVWPGPAHPAGHTYYVAMSGSDTNTGSIDHPWRTLQHAVDHVAPGDSILVRSGSYVGCRIERSGRPDAWLTLAAASGAQVIVNVPGPHNRHGSNIEVETWEGDGCVAYWVIAGLEVINAPRWGIDLRGSEHAHSHHLIVSGNKVHHNGLSQGKTGIFAAFVDDIIVENNESRHNGEHGIYLSNSGDRFVVRGNRIEFNAACGLHINGDLSAGGDGIISDGLVEDNIIDNNGRVGGAAINMDGVTNTLLRNNLLYNNHAGGVAFFQEDGAACSHDNRLYNNSIIMSRGSRWAINIAGHDCSNNRLFNNIIYSPDSNRGSIVIPTTALPGFVSDYNVVVDRFSADDGDTVIPLSQWRALGYGHHSLVAAPAQLFVDATLEDYHLRVGSPAIDAGMALTDVPRDIEGRSRPAGTAFDIGAYEYAGQTTTPTPSLPQRRLYLPLLLKRSVALPTATPFSTATPTGTATPTSTATPTGTATPSTGTGHISYQLAGGHLYLLEARSGATPLDVSQALDRLAAGSDDSELNVSPDGQWLLLYSDRFDANCSGWPCLSLVHADFSAGEAVTVNGEPLHGEGFAAVASGGQLIVYSNGNGASAHVWDLWATRRSAAGWTAPLLLTAASPYRYNEWPAMAADGSKVLFSCGDTPYGEQGMSICEVHSDGTSFRVLLKPEQGPGGKANNQLRSPDYAPDGSIVFEADWGDNERIWRWRPGTDAPRLIDSQFGNDNSPCVLPDGRVVSLWLDRPANTTGVHELKIMAADGSGYTMALTGVDVADIGLGCGK